MSANYAYDDYAGKTSTVTDPETQRQPQVGGAIAGLDEAVAVAQKTASELEARLNAVLRSEPQAAGSASKDSPTVVPMASHINEIAQRVRALTEQLSSLTRRLEV